MDNTFQAFPVIGHFVLFLNLIFWEIKFIYSEKATKFCKISTSLWFYVVLVKSKVEIFQIFLAFSKYINFTILCKFFNCYFLNEN